MRSFSVFALSFLAVSMTTTTTDAFTSIATTGSGTATGTATSPIKLTPPTTNKIFTSASTSTSSSTTTEQRMTLTEVSDFYQTYPIQSAVLTCGFKASIADMIAQWKSTNMVVARRNLAYVLYGGIFVGLMCNLEYNHLFPIMFGTENQHSWKIVAEKVLFDDFISAPLLWLPPAYLIKALVYNYPMKQGLEKYLHDIQHNGLLIKYWTIWVPAQTISFSVVPDHMRVAFMASISFFWFILFSSVSSQSDGKEMQMSTQTQIQSGTSTTTTTTMEVGVEVEVETKAKALEQQA